MLKMNSLAKRSSTPAAIGGVDQEFLRRELGGPARNATHEGSLIMQGGDERRLVVEVDGDCIEVGRRGWSIISGGQTGNSPDLKSIVIFLFRGGRGRVWEGMMKNRRRFVG